MTGRAHCPLTTVNQSVYHVNMADKLMGVSEVAAAAGVSRQAVTNWRTRHPDFPKPEVELQSGPVFSRYDIQLWLRKRGRFANDGDVKGLDRQPGPMVLRHFLYADWPLIRAFLAQIDRVPDDQVPAEADRSRHPDSKAAETAKTPGADRSKPTDVDPAPGQSGHMAGPSAFQHLREAMEEETMLRTLDTFDDQAWAEIKNGEIIELPVCTQPIEIETILGRAASVPGLEPLVRAAKYVPGETATSDSVKSPSVDFTAFTRQLNLSLIVVPVGNPRVRLLCPLRSAYVGSDPVEGEMTLVAKVQHKLQPNEHISRLQIPAVNNQSEYEHRKFAEAFDILRTSRSLAATNSVDCPGAVVTTIALYR